MQICLSSKIYPLEAVLNACYVFIDRAYVFLDRDRKNKDILVSIKGKHKLSRKDLEALSGEFMNELLHCALRLQISRNNKKIREYIVGRALFFALPVSVQPVSDEKSVYKKDPLGIAATWEEKYGSKKKRRKVKV